MNKIISIIMAVFLVVNVNAIDANTVPTTDAEWSAFLDALAKVETNGIDGVETLYGGISYYGRLQIRADYLLDSNLAYTLEDVRLSKDISYEVAKAYLTRYGALYTRKTGKPATVEILSRIHNGGPSGWKKSSTIRYFNRVKKHLI